MTASGTLNADAIGIQLATWLDAADPGLDWDMGLETEDGVQHFIALTIGDKKYDKLGPLTRVEGERILDIFSAPCTGARS